MEKLQSPCLGQKQFMLATVQFRERSHNPKIKCFPTKARIMLLQAAHTERCHLHTPERVFLERLGAYCMCPLGSKQQCRQNRNKSHPTDSLTTEFVKLKLHLLTNGQDNEKQSKKYLQEEFLCSARTSLLAVLC